MIEKITLENFQSHEKTELDLSNGVNVIIGPSDSGKTAIIRALKWLVWNRPSGDAIISSWADSAKASVIVDGISVIRQKSRTNENKYVLGGNEFNAIKTEVPDEVQEILNINDINLQQQLDSPFLLDATSGEVAGHFNKIAHLDIIDLGMKNILKWTRQTQHEINNKKQLIEEAEKEEQNYTYLEDAEIRIMALEQAQQHQNNLKNTIEDIVTTTTKIQNLEMEMAKYEQLLDVEKQVNKILNYMDTRNKTYQNLLDLNKLVAEIHRVDEEKFDNQTLLEDDETIDTLLELVRNHKERTEGIKKLSFLVQRIQDTKNSLVDKAQELEKLEKTYHDSFPDICPLCGQKVRKKG